MGRIRGRARFHRAKRGLGWSKIMYPGVCVPLFGVLLVWCHADDTCFLVGEGAVAPDIHIIYVSCILAVSFAVHCT